MVTTPASVGGWLANSATRAAAISLGTVNNTAFTGTRKFYRYFGLAQSTPSGLNIDLVAAPITTNNRTAFKGTGAQIAPSRHAAGGGCGVGRGRLPIAKRFDVYAGAMFSKVSNGLSSGFLNTSTIRPDSRFALHVLKLNLSNGQGEGKWLSEFGIGRENRLTSTWLDFYQRMTASRLGRPIRCRRS